MAGYVYKVVSFEGKLKGNGAASEVSGQLESVINGLAGSGWELVTVADVGIEISPGCLAGLFGAGKSYSRFDQLVFRRPA